MWTAALKKRKPTSTSTSPPLELGGANASSSLNSKQFH